MKKILVITLTVLLVPVGVVYAGPVGSLTTFTPNTPAHAESVNDNFTEITTQINDNDGRINQLTTDVSGNTSIITNHTADIQTNEGNTTTNSTNISTNSTNILSNTTSLNSNATNISSNTSAISGHGTRITDLEGHDHDTQYSNIVHGHTPGDISGSTDADTLDNLDSNDFALSSHSHTSSSTTQYVSVSFVTGNDLYWTMEKVAVDDDEFHANADTSIWWEGLSPSGIDSTSTGRTYVPIQLPMGAMITEFGIVYYDEIGDSHPVKAFLRKVPGKRGIASIYTTGIDFTPQYAWTTSIDPSIAVVDNSSYSYHIRAHMQGGLDMAVISGMVGYVLP